MKPIDTSAQVELTKTALAEVEAALATARAVVEKVNEAFETVGPGVTIAGVGEMKVIATQLQEQEARCAACITVLSGEQPALPGVTATIMLPTA